MQANKLFSQCGRAFAAAALALGLQAAPALAASYSAGALSSTPYINSAVLGAGAFTDSYAFSLAPAAQVVGSGVSLELPLGSLFLLHIDNLTLSLYDAGDSLLDTWSGNPADFDTLLAAGNYTLKVSGTADGLAGGAYLFSIAAVPEPGQWALLAAGLGLLALRKRKERA